MLHKTTDFKGFMAAIAANSKDDLRRLVFADYLSETGSMAMDAWGSFILAQIQSPKRTPSWAVKLLQNNVEMWLEPIKKAGGVFKCYGTLTKVVIPYKTIERTCEATAYLKWRRGFPDEVSYACLKHFKETSRLIAEYFPTSIFVPRPLENFVDFFWSADCPEEHEAMAGYVNEKTFSFSDYQFSSFPAYWTRGSEENIRREMENFIKSEMRIYAYEKLAEH